MTFTQGQYVVSHHGRDARRSKKISHVGACTLTFEDGSSGHISDYTAAYDRADLPPNGPLREIAGRIQKLSYRDMVALTAALNGNAYVKTGETGNVLSPDGVLAAAEELSKS